VYDRYRTRIVQYYGGLASIMPSVTRADWKVIPGCLGFINCLKLLFIFRLKLKTKYVTHVKST